MSEVALEHREKWKSELEFKRLALDKIEHYHLQGAPITVARNACEGVLAVAMTMLISRNMLDKKEGLYRARESATDILSYYANSIRQNKY